MMYVDFTKEELKHRARENLCEDLRALHDQYKEFDSMEFWKEVFLEADYMIEAFGGNAC